VRCKYHDNHDSKTEIDKCGWIGKLSQLESHCLTECFVKCVACKIEVLRKDYEHHVDAACNKTCKHCKEKVMRKRMKLHKQFDCAEKPVKCPNEGCLVFKDLRKKLQDHKLNDCLFEPLKCPFFMAGCGKNCNGFVLRKEFETHISNNSNTTSAIISSSKKFVELENKFLVLSTKIENRVFVSKLLDKANEFYPTEEILLKKWIEIYNNNNDSFSRNKQSIENLFNDIDVEKKRKLSNIAENKLIKNIIIYEFKIPKNFKKNGHFYKSSHEKILHEKINGYIHFQYFKDSKFFGVSIHLDNNFNNDIIFKITLLNFNGIKNVFQNFTKNWKEIEGWGNIKFIKFDDLINEKFLFEENYVARIIAKIDLEIV
jgi:hypothetical protein